MKHGQSLEDVARKNLNMLVAEHKRNCNNPNCTISLILIRIWLERLGVKLTKEEQMLFL